MRLVSVIRDDLLNADNALLEMTVEEYMDIGLRVLKNNPYQRNRVSGSSSIYSLLNRDMKRLCCVPTIVLAFTEDKKGINLKEVQEESLSDVFRTQELIILDGLQRTYTMRDVLTDLFFPEEEKNRFRNHLIRVEVYCGLTKTGILYRMLTLNTGQTPMSKRHEIEILYSGYLDNGFDGISFNRQVDSTYQNGIDTYDFDDAIEGFNSFLDADESPIDRYDLLAVVRRLEKVTNDEYNRDLFKQFIVLYNRLVHKIDELSNHWELSTVQKSLLTNIYGKDIPGFFNKSQSLSAFGAALANVLWDSTERGFGGLEAELDQLTLHRAPELVMYDFLVILQEIREGAKKIGMAQRTFLRLFFESLLSSKSESYLVFDSSIDIAKKKYDGKTI